MPDPGEGTDSVLSTERIHFRNFFPHAFSGAANEDASLHYRDFEHYVKAYKASSLEDIKLLFRRTIEGPARTWFDHKTIKDAASLKLAFLKRFGTIKSDFDNWKLFSEPRFRNGDDIELYASRLQEAATEIGISDPQKIKTQFIRGLPTELKAAVYPLAKEPIDKLVETIIEIIDLGGDTRSVSFATSANIVNMSSTAGEIATLENMQSELTSLRSNFDDIRAFMASNKPTSSGKMSHREKTPSISSEEEEEDESVLMGSQELRARQQRGRGRVKEDRALRHDFKSRPHYSPRYTSGRHDSYSQSRSPKDRYHRDRSLSSDHQNYKHSDSGRYRSHKGAVKCTYCKKPGHSWKDCYALERKMSSGEQDFQ